MAGMPLRLGSSGKGLGWVCERFQVQVLLGTTKRGKTLFPMKKKRLTGIKCVTVYNHYSLTVTKQLTALAQKISYYF